MFSKKFLVFIIQQAMTISGEFRVCDLLPKLLTDALILLGPLQPAGAIATGSLQAFFDGLDHFLIFVQSDCHKITSLLP